MSSSSPGSGSLVSWSVTAAGVLAGLGAGYALGVASSGWLASGRHGRPRTSSASSHSVAIDAAVSGNLVAALVELTAEVGEFCKTRFSLRQSLSLSLQVARLRQTVESGGFLPRLPLSRRSMRGGSTADFVSAQEDNTESDDEFFDPKSVSPRESPEQSLILQCCSGAEGEGGREEEAGTPDYCQLDELGRSVQGSQDTCESLIQQIRTALTEVRAI